MDKRGTQSINCTVNSCKHYENNDICKLASIQVSPLSSVVDTPEESMCQSFKRRDD